MTADEAPQDPTARAAVTPLPDDGGEVAGPGGDTGFAYLDSSALVKLVLEEPESESLDQHLEAIGQRSASSSIARVEVVRAVAVADPRPETRLEVETLLDSMVLVTVTDTVLADAAALASLRLRSLDAIHLASARAIPTVEFVTYDERLAEAAREQGMTVVQPGVGHGRGRAIHDRRG